MSQARGGLERNRVLVRMVVAGDDGLARLRVHVAGLQQWLARRKPHQMAWSVGLLMYAVAALMEAASELVGVWNPTVYRFYIVLAASMVGYLG